MLTDERKKEYLEKQREEMEMGFFRNELAQRVYELRLEDAEKEGDDDEVASVKSQIKEAKRADRKNALYVTAIDEFLKKL